MTDDLVEENRHLTAVTLTLKLWDKNEYRSLSWRLVWIKKNEAIPVTTTSVHFGTT